MLSYLNDIIIGKSCNKYNAEGFETLQHNAVDKINNEQIKNMNILKDKYNKQIEMYSEQQKELMQETQNYLDNVNKSEDPYLYQNVYVTDAGTLTEPAKYEGCFSSSGMLQLDDSINWNQAKCAQAAYDNGDKYFAMGIDDNGNKQCYIGDDIDTFKNGGSLSVSNYSLWSDEGYSNTGVTRFYVTYSGQISLSGTDSDGNDEQFWITPSNPTSYCHPTKGGNVNTSNTVATYGGNCDGYNSYSVNIGNWTQYVQTLDNQPEGVFVVKQTGSTDDPAHGCEKEFITSYQCGNNETKSINLSKEASGKIAVLNCRDESSYCNGFKLTIKDDYNLYLTDTNGKLIWKTFVNNTNNVGIMNPEKSAANSKYKRNYLNAGEYLDDGEFVGSPSGNCYLQFIKDKGIFLFYDKINCSKVAKENAYYATKNVSPYRTMATYSIANPPDNSNIGKAGYISQDGKIKEYSTKMQTWSDNYIELGNYANPGDSINQFGATSANECMTGCNETDDCVGFVFSGGSCQLKNADQMYPKTMKMIDNNSKLYKRNIAIDGDASCSMPVKSIGSDVWTNYLSDGYMNSASKCSLGAATQKQQKKLDKINSSLLGTVNDIETKLNKLNESDKKLLRERGLNENKIKNNLKNYKKLENKYNHYNLNKATTDGMNETSELQMISDNYWYMVWSILAISILIGSIKLAK